LLTVILPESEIEAIWEEVEKNPATVISVDLVARQVRYEEKILPFEIDDYTRWRLMEGLDEIGLTLQHSAEVADFERKRATFKPVTLTN
jgi:3-isopropylmalate/(R)-2-methylmalate dehydratase small subunit